VRVRVWLDEWMRIVVRVVGMVFGCMLCAGLIRGRYLVGLSLKGGE
jgi:hypothetical protein